MKLYLSKAHSDKDSLLAKEGKLGIIYSSKEDIFRLSEFFAEVKEHINKSEEIYMQFRDSFE